MNQDYVNYIATKINKGGRILFACFGLDGHFNPLTGIAVHLKQQGYDVRWYTSPGYRPKIESYGIPFYPLQQATDFHGADPDTVLPERALQKSQVAKLNFDIIHVFIKQGPKFYADIVEIYKEFPFDLLIADIAFTGIPFVRDLMLKPVIGIGIIPITQTSKDLPPGGIGMLPSYSFPGRVKQNLMRFAAKNVLFAKSNKALKKEFSQYGIEVKSPDNIFDFLPSKCNLVLQTGTPGFEYQRSDLSAHYKFVGPLLPYNARRQTKRWTNSKLSQYKKVVLVTQGTVEKDETKLLVPTLEALRNTDYLVVATTGGSRTESLQEQFAAPNVIIEDYIPFDDIMPHADVYITNGGMGGVQLGIQHSLPMVTAGVHEGKNEICARVGYHKLGINLKTERPSAMQIREAVEEVIKNEQYRNNISALSEEFRRYDPFRLSQKYVEQLLPKAAIVRQPEVETAVY